MPRTTLRRVTLAILAVGIASLAAVAFWPRDYIIKRRVETLRRALLRSSPDEFWSLFDLRRSCEYLENEEIPPLHTYLREKAGLPEADVPSFLDGVRARHRDASLASAAMYLRSARDFWASIDAFEVESIEPVNDNDSAALLVSLRLLGGHSASTDLYLSPEDTMLYQLPRSAFYTSAALEFASRGHATHAFFYRCEAAQDAARCATPSASLVRALLPLPSDISSTPVEWDSLVANLLDTYPDIEHVDAVAGFAAACAERGLIDRARAQAFATEVAGIRAFVAGDYVSAASKFRENLPAGLPGTCYYLSLCMEFIGRRTAQGATMADVADFLRREGPRRLQ